MRFRPWLAAAAVGLGVCPALLADDPPKKADPPEKKADEPKTPADKIAAVRKGVQEALKAAQAAQTAMQKKGEKETPEETKAKQAAFNTALAAYRKVMEEAGPKLTAVAKEFPADPAALDAIQGALQYGRGGLSPDLIGIVKEHHLKSPKLAGLLPFLMRDESPAAGDLLKAIASGATDKAVKGPANFAVASQALEKLTGYESQATKADYAKLKPELDKQLDLVAKEYADVTYGRGKLGTQVEQLRERLKKAEALLIGATAPEISAEDVDGKEFKLSDYRGKVVMIDFWGDW